MDKKKRIKHAVLVASIPAIIVFLLIVLLLKLIEAGKLSSTVVIVLLLIVCVGIVSGIVKILNGMMNCFSDVSNNIDEIANEDVKVEFNYHVKNEAIRELLEHVQGLVSEFARIIKGIKDSTAHLGTVVVDFRESFEEMSAMSENVNSEAAKIAENANNQAAMTDNFIGSIESFGNSIDTIAAQIDDLSDSAQNMKSCNSEVDNLMQDLVEISNQNGEAVENINRQTMATNQSVQEIMEAVDIITSIAGQTNLLALNASIEAARVGEQGKGFAVVAEQIGELAIQSKNSSARIAEVVDSLIHNSNESVEVTKTLEEAFNRQNEKIQETEEIFGRLNKEIENVGNAIVEIDREAESAKNHGDSMKGQMEALRETVDTNTSSIENTVSELQKFEEVVEKCMVSTETISDVSEELVGYVADVAKKKEKINEERK